MCKHSVVRLHGCRYQLRTVGGPQCTAASPEWCRLALSPHGGRAVRGVDAGRRLPPSLTRAAPFYSPLHAGGATARGTSGHRRPAGGQRGGGGGMRMCARSSATTAAGTRTPGARDRHPPRPAGATPRPLARHPRPPRRVWRASRRRPAPPPTAGSPAAPAAAGRPSAPFPPLHPPVPLRCPGVPAIPAAGRTDAGGAPRGERPDPYHYRHNTGRTGA